MFRPHDLWTKRYSLNILLPNDIIACSYDFTAPYKMQKISFIWVFTTRMDELNSFFFFIISRINIETAAAVY